MKGYAAALALGAVSLLGACTSPPATDPPSSTTTTDAQVSPTNSTSLPSTTPGSQSTTSSGEAGVPEAAKANTPQGAEAFTKYFGGIVNAAFVDQREVELQPLVLPECKSCSGISASIVSYRQKNQRFVGQYLNVTSAVFSSELSGITKVLASTDQLGGKVMDANGQVVETASPSKGNVSFQLKFDGGWRVLEMQGVA